MPTASSTYDVHAYPSYHRHQQEIIPSNAQPLSSHNTPYSDTQYPYQRPFRAASPEDLLPLSSSAGPMSGGASRSRGARALQTTEQTRHQRVQQTLHERMQDLRTSSRRERRSRGVLVDAWLKCNALPDGFDSDEDAAGRWGGIDEVSRSESPGGKEMNDPGDAGEAARRISDGLRHIGRALDGVQLPKQRKRLRVTDGMEVERPTRGAERERERDAPSSAVRPEPPTNILKAERPAPSFIQDEKEPAPAPKPKRGGKPKGAARAKAEAKANDAASQSSATASKRRKKPTRKGGDEEGSKYGEKGIPVEVFLKSTGEEPRSEASGAVDDEMSGVEETGPAEVDKVE